MAPLASLFRSRRNWIVGSLTLIALLAALAGYSYYRASRALTDARRAVSESGIISFDTRTLEATLPSGFEHLPATPGYTDAALFHDHLWLAGSGGLTVLGDGERQFRPGLELPPSPLTALATAVLREPELWIATRTEGLLATNGTTLRHIRPRDPAARKVTALAPLGNGRLAFGTETLGVLVYDRRQITWLHPALRNLRVTALAGDETSLWIGTADQGLLHLAAGELRRYPDLPDAHVTAILLDGERTFAGTPAGAVELAAGRKTRELAPGVFVQSLALRDGRLLIGTLEEGLLDLPLTATRRPGTAPTQSLEGEVRRVVTLDGQLYAITPAAAYRHGHRWERVDPPAPATLTDRNISALLADTTGRLWVGYFDRGLDVLTPLTTHVEDDRIFCINRILYDPRRQATAVATANGLVFFDNSLHQREALGREQGLIASHVTDLALTPTGLAVATPAGISFLDPGGIRSLYAFHGLVNNHVYALASEGDRLLAGTLGGLSILDAGEVRLSLTGANSGLRQNWITALARAGTDWFAGTYGSGVLRLDSAARWTALPDPSPACIINPNALLVTDDAVYAGTLDRGLAIYHRSAGRWTLVTRGLPSANVTALARQGDAILIGTDNGLVRIPEGKLLS